MDAHGYSECLPKRPAGMPGEESAMALTSGYVERARASLPRQGPQRPWRTFNNYFRDLMIMRFGDVNDGTMRFSRAGQRVPAEIAGGRG
jgi:monooxygenase